MKKLKVVVLGGGTGQKALLLALTEIWEQIEWLVAGGAVTDNGKTTKFYRDLGFPAPGDLRRTLAVLATDKRAKTFDEISPEHHQKNGNHLICTTIAKHNGDTVAAFHELNNELGTRGKVWPVTPYTTDLRFKLKSGRIEIGETTVPELTINDPIQHVSLTKSVPATKELVRAIHEADLVILGPGSTYTSIVAAILPRGIRAAIRETQAQVLYICNVSTERGESNRGVAGQIRLLDRYLRPRGYVGSILDLCLVNTLRLRCDFESELLGNVRHITTTRSSRGGTKIIRADVLDESNLIGHDPKKLAQAIASQVFPCVVQLVAV